MNLRPLTNRTTDGRFELPADGWYHLVPKGEFPHAEAKVEQVLDGPAMSSIVATFEREAAAPNFGGLLIDYDHFSYDPEKATVAAGWIDGMANRADGVWGKIRWSDEGETAVREGRYRFISPTWLPTQVERLGNGRVRPQRLDSAGLTNRPNMRGMAPLSNADRGMRNAEQTVTNPAPAGQPNAGTHTMQKIATMLGLAPEASEEAILAALQKLMGGAKEGEAAKTENTTMANRITSLLGELVLADLDAHGIKDEAVRNRLTPILSAMKNRDERVDFLALIPAPKRDAQTPTQPLTNRHTAKTPGQAAAAAKTEAAQAQQQDAKVQAIRNRERCDYKRAWEIARSESPELFQETAAN